MTYKMSWNNKFPRILAKDKFQWKRSIKNSFLHNKRFRAKTQSIHDFKPRSQDLSLGVWAEALHHGHDI